MQEQIKAGYEGLKTAPNFRSRMAQRQMIGLIAKHFFAATEAAKPMLVIEAGTGTGKTFGYCLPLIPVAQAQQKTLVVATGTIALQEQLVLQDLPMLKTLTGWDFSFALAKGRRRYVCPARLISAGNGVTSQLFDVEPEHITKAQQLLSELDDGWDGDFDRLAYPLDERLQQTFSTDAAGCTNRRCPHFDICPYMKAKNHLMNCDLVVTNHAMLIADLKLGGGAILPNPAESFHVIDEGHRLPAEVLSHNASAHLLHGAQAWLDSLMKQAQGLNQLGDETFRGQVKAQTSDTNKAAQRLKEQLQALYSHLAQTGTFHPDLAKHPETTELTTRFPAGILPDWLQQMGQEILDNTQSVMSCVNKLYDLTSDAHLRDPQEILTKQLIDLGFFKDRVQNLLTTWTLLLATTAEQPHAKWIEYRQKGDSIDFLISASPIEARTFLQANLWDRSAGVLITSATLTALGAFDYFFHQCGIDADQAVYAQFLSPFDFYHQATLAIPDLVEPTQAEHTQAIIDWALAELDPHEATLMLFTSQKQMRLVATALAERKSFTIRHQGQSPKQQLIRDHIQAIDAGEGSVLMGLDSFGEGLNLPGDYCRHLVIAKLPFPVPSSPVEQAQAEYLESMGKNAFMEISLPLTSAKLTQWVGRLIRTEEDRGRVSILDVRLLRKSYGKRMLDNLPPFRRV